MLNSAVVDTWTGHIRSGRVLAALISAPSQSRAPALVDVQTKAEHDPLNSQLCNMSRGFSGLSARQLRLIWIFVRIPQWLVQASLTPFSNVGFKARRRTVANRCPFAKANAER